MELFLARLPFNQISASMQKQDRKCIAIESSMFNFDQQKTKDDALGWVSEGPLKMLHHSGKDG